MSAELAARANAWRPHLPRLAGGIAAGVAVWFSLGTLALTSSSAGEAMPVGLLPPLWLAGVFAAVGGLAATIIPSLPTGLLWLPCVTILPWLGVDWPAAYLWSGPLAVVLWGMLAVTAIGAASWPALHDISRAWMAALVAAVCFGLFAASTAPTIIGGDQPHYLMIAGSLIHDGDFELTNDYDEGREATMWGFYPEGFSRRHTTQAPGGRQYSAHAPGVALLVLPGFAAAGVGGARAILIGVSALGLAALWLAARELTGSAGPAWAAVASLIFQLPFAAQSSSIYPDGPAAALVCVAFLTLTRIERRTPVSAPALIGSGAALAMLPWLHPRLLLLAGVFGGALLAALWYRERRIQPLALVMAVPVASLVVSVAISLVMFGVFDPTAPYRPPPASIGGARRGVVGLLADHEYGLLPYAPALAFAAIGFRRLRRAAPLSAWSSLVAVVATVILAASYIWWAGKSAPARYLVPILPVLAVSLAVFWSTASRVARAACRAAMVVGGALCALAAWADRGLYVTTEADGRYSIFEWANALVRVPDALPSVFRDAGRLPIELGIALLWASLGIGLVMLASLASRRIARQADWRTVSAWLMVAWISMSTTITWAVRGVDPRSPDRSQVDLLQDAAGAWLTTGYRHGHLTSRRDDVLESLRLAPASERDAQTLLHVPRVPAGRYQIEVVPSRPVSDLDTRLTLSAGRDPWPLAVWPLSAPDRAPSITLVTAVHSLRVSTSQPAATPTQVLLRPLGQEDFPSVADPVVAEHVVRYGELLVYLIEPARFIESGLFWLRGEQRAHTIIARDDGTTPAVRLTLGGGAMATSVRLARGDWQQTVSIPAESETSILIPATDRPAVLVMTVTGGDRTRPAVWVSPRLAAVP